jgi:hypothetical protein
MAVFMQQIFDTEIMATRKDGQMEYAGAGQDAFANFNRLSVDLEIDRKKILWVYAMKHRDGIASYLNGHKSQREDVTGRIKDLIVYLFLLWGMILEERPEGWVGNPLADKEAYFNALCAEWPPELFREQAP